jgi:hypothetical protein
MTACLYALSSEEQSPSDLVRHAHLLEEAGFDVYIHQVGPDQEGLIEAYAREVLPRLATATASGSSRR